MSGIDTKRTLWTSVQILMDHHYGRENLSRLAREARIGPGTASRIKAQETSVGIDVLEKVAELFGVEAWQLLVPGFDPKNPPTILPVSESERRLWERLLSAAKDIQQPAP